MLRAFFFFPIKEARTAPNRCMNQRIRGPSARVQSLGKKKAGQAGQAGQARQAGHAGQVGYAGHARAAGQAGQAGMAGPITDYITSFYFHLINCFTVKDYITAS